MKNLKLITQDLLVEVAVSKYPKVAEAKCIIQTTSVSEDKIMFVRTS